jgi:hypothetical protein
MIELFTNANTSILINDIRLNSVTQMEITETRTDTGRKKIQVVLYRNVVTDENIVNDMRMSKFSFRVIHNKNFAGYVGEEAEVTDFHMYLRATEDMSFFTQVITFTIPTLFYVADARSTASKQIQKEDLDNLIKIIEENKVQRTIPAVTLPVEKLKKKKASIPVK